MLGVHFCFYLLLYFVSFINLIDPSEISSSFLLLFYKTLVLVLLLFISPQKHILYQELPDRLLHYGFIYTLPTSPPRASSPNLETSSLAPTPSSNLQTFHEDHFLFHSPYPTNSLFAPSFRIPRIPSRSTQLLLPTNPLPRSPDIIPQIPYTTNQNFRSESGYLNIISHPPRNRHPLYIRH